ncbi:M1 family metallopeptidase [Ferruginibacter sp.]
MKQTAIICLWLQLLMLCKTAGAQNNTGIDVQHYRFELSLSDNTDTINGTATIGIHFLQNSKQISLDLASVNSSGKGMQVMAVMVGGKKNTFRQEADKLRIPVTVKYGDSTALTIQYRGVPADGLIISKNIFYKRTFFGDNWPNRARCWLPCNDIPADKASLEFIVTAPAHYSVISNGIKVEERSINDSTKLTHWKEDVPLPTKVMVIGAANFAVSEPVYAGTVPVTSWVYAEDKDQGFYDYAKAKDILQFFSNYIGPYGYKKLANVQSKTNFGGMENAGAIFYYEQSVTGKGKVEDLLAHEIAHQWFGDMVTETNFKHLWLSEGFATYLTDIYLEAQYGSDSLQRRLADERNKVAAFAARSTAPVIDTSSDYLNLLNANSYQKGAWVLHMLRQNVGDSVFRQIIWEQYKKFAGKNASTEDLIATAEKISHKKLQPFFTQWLYKPGIPVLNCTWNYNAAKKRVTVLIEQQQTGVFNFPLEILIESADGKQLKTVVVQKKRTVVSFTVKKAVSAVMFDPAVKLLWQPYTNK